MDEIGQRLDELGRAVTRDRIPSGLADVRRRANRRRRNARAGTALGTAAVVIAAGIGYGALRDRDPATVTSPAPTAQASPAPTPSPPSASPTPSPSPTPARVTETTYPKPLPGELPRATVRDVDGEITWDKPDEGSQTALVAEAATYSVGVRPREVMPRTLEVDFGFVWVPATEGVVKIDPVTLQATDYIPTGTVRALASSGYASMYAVVETDGGGLGVASWEATSGTRRLRIALIDETPGAASTVLGSQSVDGFGEVLYLARTYTDRPSEVLEVHPVDGSARVLARLGSPGTRLVLDYVDSDSARDLWVGGSDGTLRHIHDDGRVSEILLRGAVLDLDVTLDEYAWAAVARPGGPPRPVLINTRTERVTAEAAEGAAESIAAEGGRQVWTSSDTTWPDRVELALVGGGPTGVNPFTISRVELSGLSELTHGSDGLVFGVSRVEGTLIRLHSEFGE